MTRKILVLAALAAFASPVLADGIPVDPGLWSVTTTMNMPMLPQPQTMTIEECFKDDVMDMDDMATEDLDPGCTYNLANVDGNTMEWTIDCPMEGGTMHAEWQATSGGNSVTGDGKMTMNMQGQTMEMTMSWTGKRIGECK
jgi:hypothetical protein